MTSVAAASTTSAVDPDSRLLVPPLTRAAGRRILRSSWVGAVVVLALCCWLIGGFWSSVDNRIPRLGYSSPLAGQAWTTAGGDWPRGFFRLRFPVAALPASATLWVDADQVATVYVDGQRVATSTSPKPVRVADINPARVRQVQAYDIAPALSIGSNAVGLDVVDYQGKAAAFRAHVVLDYGSSRQIFGVVPSGWQTTTDVGLTGQAVPGSGTFATADFAAVGWQPAVTSSARHAGLAPSLPSAAWEDPMDGAALAGNGHQLLAATTITVPSGCSSGYVRVASTGTWQLDVDGRLLASGPGGYTAFGSPNSLVSQPTHFRTVPAEVIELCSTINPGRHTLQVRADAGDTPTVYVDGFLTNSTTTTHFQTGVGWRPVSSGGTASRSHVVPLGDVSPKGQLVRIAAPAPSTHANGHHLLRAVEVMALAGLIVLATTVASRRRRERATASLQWVALGLLPATGVVIAASELRHVIDLQPPWPDTPGMVIAVGFTAVGGLVVASAVDRLRRHSAGPVKRADRRVGRRAGWLRWATGHACSLTVSAFAVAWAVVTSYRITFQPVWQDELSSLAAAQGIRTHGIPEWPSGFEYWKSELYSALIAGVGALSHDSLAVMREVSVVWFLATILLFALVLVPLVLPDRRWLGFAASVVFATSPFEMAHARDLRMYQMEQFFVLLVAVVLLRAIVVPTTRRVAVAAAAIVTMYLTHEETFGVLVTVPLVLFGLLGMRWLRNWRWWVFGGGAVAVVGAQLVLASKTRPLGFGIDQSNGPFIRWSPSPFYYLDQVFFVHVAHAGTLAGVTLLGLVGVAVGIHRRHSLRLYLAAFWILPITVVAITLPATQTRYGFIVYPFEFALAACGAGDIAGWVKQALLRDTTRVTTTLLGLTSVTVTVALMATMVTSFSDYGPAVAAVTDTAYSQGQPDFNVTGGYVRGHLERGDAVIAVASANVVAYGIGRTPDYWMPYQPGGKLLYLFEKNGQAVDTQYGIPVLLSGDQLERALDDHPRTWLVSADSYLASMQASELALLRSRFTLVSEGETTSVFLSTR